MRILIAFSLIMALASPALAREYMGVTMPDSVEVGGKTLVLNGMGLRKKAFIKVYVGGLYLPAKETSASKILGSDTERRVVMHFVRHVGKNKICEAWKDGVKTNSPNATEQVSKDIDTLCSWEEDMQKGGEYVLTYVPGKGTNILIQGKDKGTIAGKAFADAILNCWLGPNPLPGLAMKEGMLGK